MSLVAVSRQQSFVQSLCAWYVVEQAALLNCIDLSYAPDCVYVCSVLIENRAETCAAMCGVEIIHSMRKSRTLQNTQSVQKHPAHILTSSAIVIPQRTYITHTHFLPKRPDLGYLNARITIRMNNLPLLSHTTIGS